MNKLALAGAVSALVVAANVSVVSARPASRGWYAEGGLGAAGELGDAGQSTAIGPSLSLRSGYELTSWFGLGLQVTTSSHEATVPAPPEGEWYQLSRAIAELRLGAQLGPIELFLSGGVGAAYISSDVLEKVGILDPGERFSLAIDAGAGLAYQLENRHYAVGLAAEGWMLVGFDNTQGIDGRLFLRYTF